MDKAAYVHRRKKRYMAQALTVFDEHALPLLPKDVAEAVKGAIRQKFHALALDAAEVATLKPGEELNGAAVELRDQVKVRPQTATRSATA
jgi:hypothetical protein